MMTKKYLSQLFRPMANKRLSPKKIILKRSHPRLRQSCRRLHHNRVHYLLKCPGRLRCLPTSLQYLRHLRWQRRPLRLRCLPMSLQYLPPKVATPAQLPPESMESDQLPTAQLWRTGVSPRKRKIPRPSKAPGATRQRREPVTPPELQNQEVTRELRQS